MILKLILTLLMSSINTTVTDAELNEIKILNNTHEAYFENMHIERLCIVTALWYEAGNQPFAGKLAVAVVLKNRVESKRWYPTTYCGVIKQKNQFSFIGRSKLDIPDNTQTWSTIREIIFISKLLEKKNYDMFNFLLDKDMLDATSFHSLDNVHGCSWCSDMHYIDTIGDHHFFKQGN